MEAPVEVLQIAVRALVETAVRTGDLTLDRWSAVNPLEAIRAHQKLQAERPPEYQAEVPVSLPVPSLSTSLTVSGRIDGVYDYGDWAIVEEIKTTRNDLSRPLDSVNPFHWGQVLVYSHMLRVVRGYGRVETRLVYYDVESEATQQIHEVISPDDLEAFFHRLVDRFLTDRRLLAEWIEARNQSARSLRFPFEQFRPGQRELAIEIFRTFRDGRQILAEAPTGIGKTMAAVFPAIKLMGEGFPGVFLYLTAKTTGQEVVGNAVRFIREAGVRLRVLQLTAKEKICFNPEATCDARECRFAAGYFDRVQGAMDRLLEQEWISRGAVEKEARASQVCPFELALDLSPLVDLLVGDYNYAFDPSTALRRVVVDNSRPFSLIVDEAHNLVDRAREIFSASLSAESVRALRQVLRRKPPDLNRALLRVSNWLRRAAEACREAGGTVVSAEAPLDLFPLLSRCTRLAESALRAFPFQEKPKREALLTFYFDALRFVRVGEGFDTSFSTLMEQSDEDFIVRLFCIDPAPRLKPLLERARSAVFLSATLAPVGYFRRVLGCSPTAPAMQFPSPFAENNRRVVVLGGISTLYKRRGETRELLVDALQVFVRQRPGNYLAFFPSFEYLEMVYASFMSRPANFDVLVQEPGMAEESRRTFLESFAEARPRTLVGFAVMGGVFGEAIDLVGDRLTGAAIVGVGLPGISVERETIRSYYSRQEEQGFEYAYGYPGMSRVLQAAGRVIRSEKDRGTILLVDERFLRHPYRQLMPREWKPVFVRDPEELRLTLADFWNRAG